MKNQLRLNGYPVRSIETILGIYIFSDDVNTAFRLKDTINTDDFSAVCHFIAAGDDRGSGFLPEEEVKGIADALIRGCWAPNTPVVSMSTLVSVAMEMDYFHDMDLRGFFLTW